MRAGQSLAGIAGAERLLSQRGDSVRTGRSVSADDSRGIVAGRRQRGFSLLEMMAVMVLIAIAITAVSVSVGRSLEGARLVAVSRDLVAALRYTRGQAIVKGEQKTFEVDLEAMSYQAPGKDAVKFPEKIEVKLLTAQSELSHERAGHIRFYADGSSTGGHVSLISGAREWRVNVNWLTGEVALDELQH